MNDNLKKEYEYKFSIIMAVYNVENYIAEAIDSLIAQDIGFEENVQLILIDDGSKDKSGEICDEYASLWPNNIVSLHKENGGVSSARNLGLKYAKGKYLNFMDSDDRLSSNTLSDVDVFFDIYKERVDIISIPFEFFERLTGRNIPHNRKFSNGNRIIDLTEEYNAFQFSLGAAFLRAEACSDMHFDETLVLSEDAKEIYKLFLKKPYLGLCCSACYYYRKRATVGSAVDNSQKNPTCYAYHLKNHYLFMVQNYLKNWGYVPKFVQYAIMYDLQWKVRMQFFPDDVLSDAEIEEFKKEFQNLLSYIEPEIVLSMKDLTPAQKIFTLDKKDPELCKIKETQNDTNIYIEIPSDDGELVDNSITWISNCNFVMEFIKYKNSIFEAEGFVDVPIFRDNYDFEVFAKVNGRFMRCEKVKRENLYSLGELCEKRVGFKFSLKTDAKTENYSISFFVNYYGHLVTLGKLSFGPFAPLSLSIKNSFYYREDRILTFSSNAFSLRLAGKKALIRSERAFRKEIKKRNFFDYRKIFKIRTLTYLHRFLFKKPIWLISDRINKADDNGEAFYRYIKNNKNVRSFFVIDKAYKKEASKFGKVIETGSFKHLLYSAMAEKVISSQIESKTLYDTAHNFNMIRDLYSPDRFVFLQHGIIINNCSDCLNRYSKNISLFISSTRKEYDSLISYNYGLSPQNIALTGLPRFDRLYNDPQKIITVMPTWRASLAEPYNQETGEWEYAGDFKSSDFYKFYNKLFNNEKLISSLNKNGYKLAFAPHPNLKNVVSLFDTENVMVWQGTRYRDIFAKSSLIVTDYSSAIFDFVYLKKPVVYSQFDKDTVYKLQSYNKGYFDDETMGFGEVEYDINSTVDRIIEYVENGCKLKPMYEERINSFFEFHDKNNCERVYKAIIGQ